MINHNGHHFTIAESLRIAADRILTDGWARGSCYRFSNAHGKACLVDAIEESGYWTMETEHHFDEALRYARRAVAAEIRRKASRIDLGVWNDKLDPGAARERVAFVLLKAADRAERDGR